MNHSNMDRNQAKELSPIIQAYVEGKPIQSRCIKGDTSLWYDDEDPSFDDDFEYRIKPESKYRPFANAEECWAEMQKHEYFGWIKAKDASIPSRFMIINSIRNEEVSITSGIDFTYNELVEHYTFIDKTPFGVKVEE